MVPTNSSSRAALVIAAGAMLLAATSTADAQRRHDPRIAVAASPQPEPQQTDPRRVPSWYGTGDPRGRPGHWENTRTRDQHSRGPTIIYVPVPSGYGYGYGYAPGYYGSVVYGGVSDANGRPLTMPSYESAPSVSYGYTPDLTGAPYAVSDEGMMVVDFPSGERRAFPSCADASDQRDPQGRPRTIFYQSQDYWMVLRPGQRGRVHGEPPAGKPACYAIDSVGKVVLRY